MFAFVIAIGGALASGLISTNVDGYYFATSPSRCVKVSNACSQISGPLCTSAQGMLKDSSTPIGGACGNDLFRIP
jgi:hypothetical protein